jgi:hypothetical protein
MLAGRGAHCYVVKVDERQVARVVLERLVQEGWEYDTPDRRMLFELRAGMPWKGAEEYSQVCEGLI